MSKREPGAVDITAVYDVFAGRAVEIVNGGGEFWPQLAMINLGDEPGEIGEIHFIDPNLVNALQKDGRTKDALVKLIDVLLANCGIPPIGLMPLPEAPQLVVHVTEMWRLPASAAPDADQSFADHPERGECIFVTVHTPERAFVGACPITSHDGKREATFEPILDGGEWTGRFARRSEHDTH